MRNNTPVIVGAIAAVALAVVGLWLILGNSGGPSGLTGTNWQLSAISEQTPTFQGVVPAAEQPRYAITFNDNGSYTGIADCNAISGTYTTGRNNAITIEAGASTLIACPGDSYGPLFAHAITTATTYAIASGGLTLSRDDGASMTFVAGSGGAVVVPTATPTASPTPTPTPSPTPTPTATPTPSPTPTPTATPTASPTPSPTPTAAPTAEPTGKPTAEPTATPSPTPSPTAKPTPTPTAKPTATPKPTPKPTPTPSPTPAPTPAPGGDLAGTSWQLTSLTIANPPFQGSVPGAEQPNYTIAFATDGTFSARADCNTLAGTWTAGSGGTLALRIGPSSLVVCGDDSLSDLYIIGLNNVVSYGIASKQLTLTTDDGGTLVYKAAP